MKAAIDFMNRKLASSEYSHTTAWAHVRANQLLHANGHRVKVLDDKVPRLSKDWREFDVIYTYHGVDFQPGSKYMNVFDGLVEKSAMFFERLAWPQHDHIKYVSVDYPMPDYGWLCKTKKGTKSAYWENANWDKVSERCRDVPYLLDPLLGKAQHLVIGDSHSGSVYRPPAMILRKDGRTLSGILKKTVKREIAEFGSTLSTDKWCKEAYFGVDPRFQPGEGFKLQDIESLTCYWGSIDVRHHLCREANPLQATRDLLKRYEQELLTLDGRPIELVQLLPIEDESRVIPKTGYYEDAPFYGTRQQRMEVLRVFNDELAELAERHPGWTLYRWPKHWYEVDGVEFMNTYMERPRSVHLAYKYYRWDLVRDEPNARLTEVRLTQRSTVPNLLVFE